MDKIKEYEVMTRYDNRASFYGKAKIQETKNKIILISYGTKILQLDKTTNKIKFLTENKNNFTNTTNRHINEFLQQFTNEMPKTKKELLKMANIE